jgi:hypothetical protein
MLETKSVEVRVRLVTSICGPLYSFHISYADQSRDESSRMSTTSTQTLRVTELLGTKSGDSMSAAITCQKRL